MDDREQGAAMTYVFCVVAGLVVGFLAGLWAGMDFGSNPIPAHEREHEP